MQNYIINTSTNTNTNTRSKEYHFTKMQDQTPTISVTISPTKQMKKFIQRLKTNYDRNTRDNHFIFQDNLYLKSFTNQDGHPFLKIKNLYGEAKLDVNIAVNYELLDSFTS
jgi:DNA-directed RNA polymerase